MDALCPHFKGVNAYSHVLILSSYRASMTTVISSL